AGYAHRWSNNLYLGNQLNAVPYMMRDAASGQTFAQAYDVVAQQLRAGVAPAGVTPQPWFENQLRGTDGCGASCTQFLAARLSAAFQQGQLNNLMNFINTQRPGGPIYNRQVMDLWVRTSDARFNYDAGFLSLTRRFSHGLSATAHYTFSKTLDQNGAPQSNIALASTPYDLSVDYGPALWDRTHVLNSFWYWELPFGKGKSFAGSSG